MSQLSEEDRDALTAYLDGELDEASTHAFEARLSREPSLRAEADALKRTWDLLDYLPRPEPSTTFTHRTLERLAVHETAKHGMVGAGRRWNWLAPVGWAAAMLLAMAGGLLVAHRLWPVPAPPPPVVQQPPPNGQTNFENQMVKNLGVIEN